MGRPRYICNECRKDFTRRWNATRHINNHHQGLAQIIPLGEFALRQSNHLNFPSKGLHKNQQYLTHDDHEQILVNETLSKLACKDQELDQLLLSAGYDPTARLNIEGDIIMRAINSSDPLKKYDDELSSLRRGYNCGMITNKVALFRRIHPILADAMIRRLLSSSQRTRINRIVGKDIFYRRGLGYDAYAFESTPYYFPHHAISASGMNAEGSVRRFY